MLLVAIGISPLIERSAGLLTAMKLAGTAYLVCLGAGGRQRRAHELAQDLAARRGGIRSVADGFLVGVANPKTAVFFVAILPEFASRAQGDVPGPDARPRISVRPDRERQRCAWSLLARRGPRVARQVTMPP